MWSPVWTMSSDLHIDTKGFRQVSDIQTKKTGIIQPALVGLKAQGREVLKPTAISSSVEPLEKAPEEAEWKELAQCPYLLPEIP